MILSLSKTGFWQPFEIVALQNGSSKHVKTHVCIATFISNISIVPVSTWNTYNILTTATTTKPQHNSMLKHNYLATATQLIPTLLFAAQIKNFLIHANNSMQWQKL